MAIIYGVPPSPYVRKVMLAHAFKGVSYDLEPTMPGSEDPIFRAASPLGKIPAYRVNENSGFSDSSVIVAYLERTETQTPLYPTNAEDYGQALWLEKYCDTKLAEVISGLYFQLVVGPAFFEHTTEEERVADLVSNLIPEQLAYLESTLANNTYFVGNEFSVADLSIGVHMMSLKHAKFEIDAKKYPAVAKFAADFCEHPMVVTQLAQESAMIGN